MTATKLDPRVVADALETGTFELAAMLRQWAGDHLVRAAGRFESEFVEYDRLAQFDEDIRAARRQLEAAIAAEQAWHADNPLDEDES